MTPSRWRLPLPGAKPSLPLLAATTMTGTAALHIFVPVLPAAARDLHASPLAAQLTITLFLCGLAVGQLVYGPISDRFGRRPILIVSLLLSLAGFVLAAPATTIEWLVGARVLQSLGSCGALVLGRAMVRDISTSEDAAKKLAYLILAMTLTPAMAPALGGVIGSAFGWRAIFVTLAAILALLLALVLFTLPETNKRPVRGVGLAGTLRAYGRLLRSGKFRRYLIAGACSGTSLYAFLAVAPFLYVNVLGRSADEVGLFCVAVSLGMALGALLVRFVIGRMDNRRGAQLGNLVCLGAALLLLGLDVTGRLSVIALTGPMIVYALGIGIGGPNVVAGAMNVDPEAAGAASGLYGFGQMTFGAVFTLIVGIWHDATAMPLAVILACASITGFVALRRA